MNGVKAYLAKKKDKKTTEELVEKVFSMVEKIKGDKGDSIKGEKGEQGDKGEQGASIKGDSGDKGDKGDKGEKGEQGERGFQGETGKDGKGIDGKNGDIITSEEVATKLNTLEEVLDTKVLKGFKKIIKQLEDKIFYAGKQKSGGGMGMPIHETFSVSGSTTSITLSYNVAANGRAIFTMRYQGQSLHWGEHYTVSGKVISLLFTPVDNSTVDISYIRTN